MDLYKQSLENKMQLLNQCWKYEPDHSLYLVPISLREKDPDLYRQLVRGVSQNNFKTFLFSTVSVAFSFEIKFF